MESSSSSLIKNINEIKLFKDYHILESYIGKQLYYLYHSCVSSKSPNENLNLLKESIESFSNNDDNQNDLTLAFSILNSFQSFLINKLNLINNNSQNQPQEKESRDNNDNELLLNIDIGFLYIYKWLINGLFSNKIKSINYYSNEYKASDITLLKDLVSNILYNLITLVEIPDFLKTIEEQKSYSKDEEYNLTIQKSNQYKLKIQVIFEIISSYFKNEIDSNGTLNIEYKTTLTKQLFFRLLEFKLTPQDQQQQQDQSNNSDMTLMHWTNKEISNVVDEILVNFKSYISRKHNFINSLVEFYQWSKSDIENHFKLLSSNENENRWKFNTPYIHSFYIFITSVSNSNNNNNQQSQLYELFYKSSIQFHKFIITIVYNLLDCTNNDIKYKSIDIIIFFINNFNNNQIKSFLTIDNNNQYQINNNKIYNKLVDILKLADPSSISSKRIAKCTKLVFDLLFILYPVYSNGPLINPLITPPQSANLTTTSSTFIETLQQSQKLLLSSPIQSQELNNFSKYQEIFILLVSILDDIQQQQQPFQLVKKVIFLSECKRSISVLGLYTIQYFKILIPTILKSINESSLHTDQELILELLDLLNEISKYCWIRLVSYTNNILNSILPLYNNNNDNNNNNKNSIIYNQIIVSIIGKLYLSFNNLNKLSDFYKIINNDQDEINQIKINQIINNNNFK